MKELYEKYQLLNIPNKYQLSDVDVVMKEEYLSKEIHVKDMDFLLEPENIDKFIKCYKLDNKEILDKLFSEEEKQSLIHMKIMNEQYPPEPNNLKEMEDTCIQNGEYLVVFIGSMDGKYIEDLKLVGSSSRLFDRLLILAGIEKEDCQLGNIMFEHYLSALSNLGYLD